ncbi:hypothetical protein COCNU_scaffold000258G000010 [Cocos nucifera]|nr:hypothetical protein [Cocos nucifera]
MACDETMTAVHDLVDDDDDGFVDTTIHFVPDGDGDDDDDDIVHRRMSRLSIETSDGDDADSELSGEEEEERKKSMLASLMEEVNFGKDSASTAWTPLRRIPYRAASKEHASETEVRGWGGSGGGGRERWLLRAWEMKKRAAVTEGLDGGAGGVCRVLVRPRAGVGPMCMDMEEVKACRDLGLELPCDWTVEIPCGHSGSTVDTTSRGNSPVASWRISSAGKGDDPADVKAMLKVWAQVVAFQSASRLSG